MHHGLCPLVFPAYFSRQKVKAKWESLIAFVFSFLLLCFQLCHEFNNSWCKCPLAGLVCALNDAGQVSAGKPWSVWPPSLMAAPVLLSTFVRGLADSSVGLASSPSSVRASHCTPNCGRSSRIASRTSISSERCHREEDCGAPAFPI